MIVPDPEDIDIVDKVGLDFEGRYSQLFQNLSPILPLHFDKSYLPKNICERQFIDLVQCTLFRTHDDTDSCSYEIVRFQQCRKNRDIKILEGIKQWQRQHILNLDKINRQFYLQGLTFKLDRLKDEYGKMPSTQAKSLKLHQIQSEIQQIKWRMKNIKTTIKQSESLQKAQSYTNKSKLID